MPLEDAGGEDDEGARGPALVVAQQVALVTSRLRNERGWTLEDLADEAGLHRTHIGLAERGERHLSLAAAHQLAGAFGLSLSELVALAENELASEEALGEAPFTKRTVDLDLVQNPEYIREMTGLGPDWIARGIEAAYATLDLIDERLLQSKSPPLTGLVELANLSSMLGNLLGSGLANASDGTYVRNRPHAYPDLISQRDGVSSAEIKTALEKNKPKGHLPKPGLHLTFRYVLGARDGSYTRGKLSRGDVVWIWEARMGFLEVPDYAVSNTEGDSGKTAVIRAEALKRLACVYFSFDHNPYIRGSA